MRRSKQKEIPPAEKLTRILEEILTATPEEATESIMLRCERGKLGKPNTRFGPRTSERKGCVPCPDLGIATKAYIVPGTQGKRMMIATPVEWPKSHSGLFALQRPVSYINTILYYEKNVVLPEVHDQLIHEMILDFEDLLKELRAEHV